MGAAGVRKRRCLPLRGKSASELARLILGYRGGEQGFWSALPIRNGWQARRENGKRTAIHADCVSKTPPASTVAPSGTNRSLSAPYSWGRQASTSSQRRCQPALPARRALPAPAQGINPLRIPFWGTAAVVSPQPRPQRRRRQAPARGLVAVYSHHRSNRNETTRPSPLLVGLGRVYFEPTALAGGTAALCRVSWPFSCIPR